MKKKKAFITGITGQDGSYLAEFLLEKGYDIHGLVRRVSTFNRERIDHLFFGMTKLHYGNLTDSSSLGKILGEIKPDEIYNLGAQSHVGISFEVPEETSDIVALGTLRILEAYKKLCPEARFYQASSSEMFGECEKTPQTEKTPFHPRSPYACAKVYAHHITINYREAYNLHASNGILFNHESERRGENFVTRKITRSLTRIKLGLQDKLYLGNLDAERDWGYAKDFVEAMWLMLQQEKPGDYVIGTGEKYSVREFLERTAEYLDLRINSNCKKEIEEKYLDKNGKIIVEIDKRHFRPLELNILLSDSSKAKKELGWKPKVKFNDLIKLMADHDLKLAENEFLIKNKDGKTNKYRRF